ncbi:GDSL-type esterase/lipase family protein [Litorisediminicola beolgyonensis]|uniref:GDSL-type esterase/lipase family protein n=1 Tax=Litorisediminicola beolgyonensis TaxID=1173614 RepID=A0ABW3ZGG0_9RHOB
MVKRALLYGDSNTHGTEPYASLFDPPRRFARDVRWPGVAAAMLGPGWELIEEGLPGRTTVFADPVEGAHLDGLAVLPAVLKSHVPLDACVIMLGTNDLKARFGPSATEVAQGAARLLRAVAFHCPGLPVLLVAPPCPRGVAPFSEIFRDSDVRGAGLGAAFAAQAERFGARCLDAGTVIEVGSDGVHFGPEAHAALGHAIAKELAALVA